MWSCWSKHFGTERTNGGFRISKAPTEEERFFLENGARVLEQLITSFNGKCNPVRNFSKKELTIATNNYDPDGILHKDLTYLLYKGSHESRPISVKKFTSGSPQQFIGWYINEVAVASHMSSHKHVLKLLGCCLETEVPTLVYEFFRNGDLSEHIFTNDPELTWARRLRIATQIADAVAYLHNSASRPIIHREVKSRNIFLDQDYNAKLFEFGLSVLIPPGEEYIEVDVLGSVGFVAPESHATGRFTEKNDVYSFGAVMFEILTRQRAWNLTEKLSVSGFPSVEIEDEIELNLRTNLLEGGIERQVMECVELTLRCLRMNFEERPTMKEVARALRLIGKHQDTSLSTST